LLTLLTGQRLFQMEKFQYMTEVLYH
jgi:hypothetical protein